MSATRGFLTGFIITAGVAAFYGEAWLAALSQPPGQDTGPAVIKIPAPLDTRALTPIEGTAASTESASAAEISETGVADTDIRSRWAAIRQGSDTLQPSGDFPWRACFQRAAATVELPEALLLAVARGESNFDPTARSESGAVGLMQIRWPETAHHLGLRRERELYDPCANVSAGARYLKELAARYANDWHLVLAAYNYGPSRVSEGHVPDGASWYSEYIYQHLQAVLGSEAANLPAPRPLPAEGSGRQQLVSFSQPQRAEAFLSYLRGELPNLALTWTREPLGAHTVYLLYDSEEERLLGLQAITANGVIVPGIGPQHSLTF